MPAQDILGLALAAAIGTAGIAAGKRGLHRGRQHDRTRVARCLQRVYQRLREVSVTAAILRRILRAVDPRQVNHGVRMCRALGESLRRVFDVKGVNHERQKARELRTSVLAVADVAEALDQVATHEAGRACHQDAHHTSPASACCTYVVPKSLCTVPSTSSRTVLSEV